MTNPTVRRRDLLTSAAAVAALVAAGQAEGTSASAEDGAPARRLTQDRAKVEWPMWDDSEAEALLEVLNSGKWGRTSGGKKLREFEAAFASAMQAQHCLATSSGTTALLTTLVHSALDQAMK